MSLISIIIPVYNVEEYLCRCVDSIINQTYTDLEIILVNDGSTDKSGEICENYLNLDPRVKVIHKINGGLSDARNEGLKNAHGQYILYVDSDDYIEPNACKELIVGFDNNNKDIDIVVGDCKVIHRDKIEYLIRKTFIPNRKYNSKEFLILSIKNNIWFAQSCLAMYKRSFLIKNNLYFKKGIIFEDSEILPRMYLSASHIVYVNTVFYNYVLRSSSITQSGVNQKKIDSVIEIFSEWKIIFDGIKDPKLQKYMYGILSKSYISSCRNLKIAKPIYPKGITNRFLIQNNLGGKDFIKTLLFCVSRKFYINL